MGVELRSCRRTNQQRAEDAEHDRLHPEPLDALGGEGLDAVHDRAHGREREHRAQHVDAAGRGIAALGDEQRHEHEHGHEHRHGEQEHGAPREVLEQHAADERPEGAAGREARRPDRDGESALLAVGEDGAQQRQRRGHQHGPEEPERRAGGDQGLGGGRERGDDRDRREAGRPDQQHAASAEAVARAAHPDQEAGEHQRVRVDDPELLGRRRCEVARDRRQREAQHGVVDRHEQHRQHEHRERDPRAPRCTRRPTGVDARGGLRRALDRLGGWLRGVRHLGFHYFTVQPV